jgi:hypothetical protein
MDEFYGLLNCAFRLHYKKQYEVAAKKTCRMSRCTRYIRAGLSVYKSSTGVPAGDLSINGISE